MLIDDKEEYDLVWDKVYDKLKFNPSCSYRGHSLTVDLPFEIEGNFAVYGIDKMSDSQINSMQDMVREEIYGRIYDLLAQRTDQGFEKSGGHRSHPSDVWQHTQ